MTKFITLLLGLTMTALGLVAVTEAPANSSVSAYTWVKHTNATGLNHRIMVRCHVPAGSWRTLFIGDASGQVCGSNGWVEAIWAIDGDGLNCVNLNTGNTTTYPRGYKGSIGGGSYYCFLDSFTGGSGGGGGGGA